jgi:ADP-ribose pyrophosphatase YjhB (NUDIX family)
MHIEVFDNGLTKEDITNQKKRIACRGIIKKGNQYMITHLQDFDIYKFPGGGVEGKETLEEACVREVQEETGLQVSVKEHVLTVTEVFIDQIWENNYFLCEVIGQTSPSFTSKEMELKMEYFWIDESELLHILSTNEGNHPYASNIHQREFMGLFHSIK